MNRFQATRTIRVIALTLALVGLLAACRPGRCPTFPEAVLGARSERSSAGLGCSVPSQVGKLSGRSELAERAARGCTVFTVAKGDRVFFGGNDDYIHPDSYYWVEPGQGDDYGVVWIGRPDNVQQGVNEVGLAYDSNGLPEVEMNPHRERIPWSGHMGSAQMHILHECATVEEAIEWVQTHQVWPQMNDQRQFADASGDAVLIGPGPDGELVFTRKPRGDGYLVSTNYNVVHPEHRAGSYPCARYETARAMLGKLVARAGALAAEDAARVLDAVHQEGGSSWTLASLVADLPNGLIYLYFFYQFDKPVVLSVADELANPRAPGPLSALFAEDVRQEGARRYARFQSRGQRCRWLGTAWIAAVFACLVLLVLLSPGGRLGRPDPAGMHFWVLLVLVLGPLGFAVWAIARGRKAPPPRPLRQAQGRLSPADPGPPAGEGEEARARAGASSLPPVQPTVGRRGIEGGQERAWRAILLEAAGDVTPSAFALTLHLVLALRFPAVLGGGSLPLALIAGLPLAVGWLAFQGPLLALESKRGYLRTLWQRLPHALVAANLGMAGVLLGLPLAVFSFNDCPFFPEPGLSVGVLWACAALGALPGGLLLALYHLWAVRRGLAAWRAVGWKETPVRSARWRVLWWWVLIGYGALLGGVAACMRLLQLISA